MYGYKSWGIDSIIGYLILWLVILPRTLPKAQNISRWATYVATTIPSPPARPSTLHAHISTGRLGEAGSDATIHVAPVSFLDCLTMRQNINSVPTF